MTVKYLIQTTTCPVTADGVSAAIAQHTDATMKASGVPIDHTTRWWYREHIVPDLATDSAGVWYLTCCQIIEDETRENMFSPTDWQYEGLVITYHECGNTRPSEEMFRQCSENALANAGLTRLGPRGPIDEMLAGTWQIGDRDFRQYVQERLVG